MPADIDKNTQELLSAYSLKILKLIGNKKRILDIGSGAGFPAIVCAICSNNNFDLVEANKKK